MNINVSIGEYLDRVSIYTVKKYKDVSLGKEESDKWKSGMRFVESHLNIKRLFDELVHINALIWWCMDKQREYSEDTWEDRREIGMIVAVLNDKRDEIKKKINEMVGEKSAVSEQKDYAQRR